MQRLSEETFSSIGRLVYRFKPELANYLATVIDETKPEHAELKHIRNFMVIYCKMKGLPQIPKDSRASSLYLKHVFIAAIIKIYNPEILTGIHSTRMRMFLRKRLASILEMNPNCISNVVPTIVKRMDIYLDFKTDVNETYLAFHNSLKSNGL